jgi:hypothetical protein
MKFLTVRFGLPDGVSVDGLDGIFVLTIDCVVDEVSDSACEGASDGDKSDCKTSSRIMWTVLIVVNAVAGASGFKMTMRFGKLITTEQNKQPKWASC